MINSHNEAIRYWDGKPYYSLNTYLKTRFGHKVKKIALNGGFTCPNRDGTLDTRGCIFCSEEGSGDFAVENLPEITDDQPFIAYFQSFTNTYGSVERI